MFDLFVGLDHNLLVLTGGAAPRPVRAGEALARMKEVLGRFSFPVQVHEVGPEETAAYKANGADPPTMVLIRPHGDVAWRGALDDPAGLDHAVSRWFHRTGTSS